MVVEASLARWLLLLCSTVAGMHHGSDRSHLNAAWCIRAPAWLWRHPLLVGCCCFAAQ